jgi:poly(beta-D-mannuronate) lyase
VPTGFARQAEGTARTGRNGVGRALLVLVLAGACAAPVSACPAPPPAVRDIDLPRFYSDEAGSRIDPKQRALNAAAGKPLTEFLRFVTKEADRSLKSARAPKREEAAQCAASWIAAWAAGDAWLGRMETQQAEYQRKWDLAGVSLAYLKVKPHATAQQRRVIEPWLNRFADASRAFFNNPMRKRNNHWYWLGLALAGTALAIDSDRHWSEARRIMQDAARDIRADGALPMELARGGRAAHYHAFAVMPLVVLAELAATRGEDWYGFNNGALHRLVALTVKGFEDPSTFERLAQTPQQSTANSMGTGWLPLYVRRFPDRLRPPVPDMRTSHRWTGGDVMLLIAKLEAGAGKANN